MDVRTVTHPTVAAILPAELTRLKTFLRIETDDEDTDLKEYYLAASQMFEKLSGRSVFTTARRYAVPYGVTDSKCVEGIHLELPYPNLLAVSAVKWFDEDDVEQTLDPDYYVVQTVGDIGRVTVYDEGMTQITSISSAIANQVVIYYTSGYGDDTDDVPIGVRQWLREFTKWSYGVKNNATLSRSGVPDYLVNLAAPWYLGKVWR